MPRGMKYPVAVNPAGGATAIEGSFAIHQNVILALIPAGSLHPWNQEIVPDEDIVFDILDTETGNSYTMHVREFFAEMERQGYARLLPGERGLKLFVPERPGGEMMVGIQFENLESGKVEGFRYPIPGGR